VATVGTTPLIAAVEGWALGGGTEVVLACDPVVAARNASFGLPEVTRGIIAPEGGLVRLPRRSLVAPSPGWVSGT
jgi:enoyl-CoA hydratase